MTVTVLQSVVATATKPAKTKGLPLLPLWAAIPVAAVAGVLLDLATPDVGWWPLTLPSVALALATLVGRRIGAALLVGTMFGVAFYTLHLAWVGQFLGPLPRVALTGLEAALIGIGAIPIALAYRWTARYRPQGARQLLLVPLLIGGLWTSRELIIGAWPYSGFPWARLGLTQVDGPLRETMSWIGATGLSLLIAVLAASLVQWVRAGSVRFLHGLLPVGIVLVTLAVIPAFPTTPAGAFTVGSVQGNGPAGYFDNKAPGDVLAAQVTATSPVIGRRLDLVVWPEGSVDSDPLRTPSTAAVLDRVVAAAGAPLLANAATTRGTRAFNTSLLWTAEHNARQLHDKVNPVPFGEYVPDRWLYERIAPDLVGLLQRDYTPGTNIPVVMVGKVAVGLAICFDVIFDPVIWAGIGNGAQLLVFQTNNADFRGTDENLQQLAIARMRAIETGRAVINVSTVGTSQVITPAGNIVRTLPAGDAAASVDTVPLRTGLTPAVVLGPWLVVLIHLFALTALIVTGVTHRHQSTSLTDRSGREGRPVRD